MSQSGTLVGMSESIVDVLRAALKDAMLERDKVAMSALRAGLAAVDNAQAVPLTDEHRAGAIEASANRPNEVERLELTEGQMRTVVQAEVAERLQAVAQVRESRPDHAADLEAGAELLQRLLDRP